VENPDISTVDEASTNSSGKLSPVAVWPARMEMRQALLGLGEIVLMVPAGDWDPEIEFDIAKVHWGEPLTLTRSSRMVFSYARRLDPTPKSPSATRRAKA
jgi:hypothetical protein